MNNSQHQPKLEDFLRFQKKSFKFRWLYIGFGIILIFFLIFYFNNLNKEASDYDISVKEVKVQEHVKEVKQIESNVSTAASEITKAFGDNNIIFVTLLTLVLIIPIIIFFQLLREILNY